MLILQNPESKTYILVNENDANLPQYAADGFNIMFEGKKRQALEYLDEYWDMNDTPVEQRVISNQNY